METMYEKIFIETVYEKIFIETMYVEIFIEPPISRSLQILKSFLASPYAFRKCRNADIWWWKSKIDGAC